MKSSILRAGVVALACAVGLSACGGGSGDLNLYGALYNVNKDGLVLQNNGGQDLAVTAANSNNYSTFQFPDRLSTDDEFNITVKSVPTNNDACKVINGKARANYYTIQQVQIQCTIKQVPLTVTINNLKTSGLVLVNGADRKDVPAGATSQVMAQVFVEGAYGVTILQQPTGQTCTVSGGDNGQGSGKVPLTPVTNVAVNCA